MRELKTIFCFSYRIYAPFDGVILESPLSLFLANIAMTKVESATCKEPSGQSLIRLCIRYIEDSLYFFLKKRTFDLIKNCLNSFHKNTKFTVNTFKDQNVHFLDIKIDKNKIYIYISI